MIRRFALFGFVLVLTVASLPAMAARDLWITAEGNGKTAIFTSFPREWCRAIKEGIACWGSNGHGNTISISFKRGSNQMVNCWVDYDYVNRENPHLRGTRQNCTGQLRDYRIYVQPVWR